jgi:amidase
MTHPFTWPEWGRISAHELSARVRRGDVSAAEVAKQSHAAAAATHDELQALVELFDAPAVASDVALPDGASQGLLAGVPLYLKDLGSSMAGVLRENGSALHRGERTQRTDPLIAEWLREGAQVLGRATTAELGMAYDTVTVYQGLQVTRNPWNTAHSAGGSSGGSAALVAAGVTPLAHATDGAGSIRIPSALNGLVGLKVSRGRSPLPWHVNELLNTSMVEGVIARHLVDAALALDAATRRPAPAGKHFVPTGFEPTQAVEALQQVPQRLRIGFSTDAFGRDHAPGAAVVQRVRNVAQALSRAGHQVEEIGSAELPDFAALWRSFETFWAGMRAASWQVAKGDASPGLLASLSPMVAKFWAASSRYDKLDVMRYQADNVRHTLGFAKLLEQRDVLLLPAFPYATPLAHGDWSPAHDVDFDGFLKRFLDTGRYTIPANETGLPALALPAGLGADGLPVGVQLYGRWREETALLQAGAAVQQVIEGVHAVPAVHVSRLTRV